MTARLTTRMITRLIVLLIVVVLAPGAAGRRLENIPPPGTGTAYLAGQLLVATPQLKGPIFHHTVIFMFRHGPGGAMGIIINRPSQAVPLTELLRNFRIDDIDGVEPDDEMTVFFGGPVKRRLGMVLHSTDFTTPETITINRFASATGAGAALRAIAEGRGPQRALLAVGFAGWAPGQLEQELARNSWVVAPADENFLFDTEFDTKWQRAFDRRGVDL